MASDRKNLSRRNLLSLAGGAFGLITAGSVGTAGAISLRKSAHDASAPNAKPANEAVPVAPPAPVEKPAGPVMREQPTVPAASPDALSVLGGVTAGTRVGPWHVAAIYDFHLGAVPVVLESSAGGRFQVDVLKRDTRPGAPKGVADTRHLSLFLSNKGNGATPSDEHHGLGLMALAAAVQQRESFAAPKGLLTLAERVVQFPRAGYSVPV